jgi:hypothetical protein
MITRRGSRIPLRRVTPRARRPVTRAPQDFRLRTVDLPDPPRPLGHDLRLELAITVSRHGDGDRPVGRPLQAAANDLLSRLDQ